MSFPHGPSDGNVAELVARSVGETLREAAAASMNRDDLSRQAERLRRAIMQTRAASDASRAPRWKLGAALAAAGISLAVGWFQVHRASAPMQAESVIGSSHSFVGVQHVAAPEVQPAELRFSDGSLVKVAVGARVRIEELLAVGATLLVEKGQAEVQVRHRDGTTRWRVLAGPFSIAVTGTQFGVSWSPASEQLVVELHEGRVEISGPKFEAPAVLTSGQRFEATMREARWSVTPVGQASPSTASVPTEVGANSEAAVAAERLPSARKPKGRVASGSGAALGQDRKPSESGIASAAPDEGRQWSKLVAGGEFKQVTREADAMGLMSCLAQCSASDLRALADASRYTGRLDTAEAALRVLHDRHPPQANTAAYLLGMIDETRGRSTSALRWYEDYLSRTSSGAFVPEARAARLRLLVATGDDAAARKAAREYVEMHPNGAGAALANRVLANQKTPNQGLEGR